MIVYIYVHVMFLGEIQLQFAKFRLYRFLFFNLIKFLDRYLILSILLGVLSYHFRVQSMIAAEIWLMMIYQTVTNDQQACRKIMVKPSRANSIKEHPIIIYLISLASRLSCILSKISLLECCEHDLLIIH